MTLDTVTAPPSPAIQSPVTEPKVARWLYLDVLRGVAILLVLGAHTMFRLPEESFGYYFYKVWNRGGWIGVDLFFVLSGFLIGGLLFAEQRKYQSIHFGRFLMRRTFKIWPAYLVFLAAAFAWGVHYLPDHALPLATRIGETVKATWPYLVHIQNYMETPMVEFIGHPWSLAVEEHFYLLLPLLLFVLSVMARSSTVAVTAEGEAPTRRTHDARVPFPSIPWICLVLVLGCLGLRYLAWYTTPLFSEYKHHWPTHLRIDSLFVGVTLSFVVHFRRNWIEMLRPWRWGILAVSLPMFLLIPLSPVTHESKFCCTTGYTLLAMGSMGMVLVAWFASVPAPGREAEIAALAAKTVGPIGKTFGAIMFAMAWVGERSYSIYLWHNPFINPLVTKFQNHAGDHLHLWGSPWLYTVVIAFYVVVAIALGSVMFYLVEAPSVLWRERWFPSRSKFESRRKSTVVTEPITVG